MTTKSVTGQIRTQTSQKNNVPFFPPPPVPSTSNKKSSSSRLNPTSVSEKSARKTASLRPPRSHSLRHTVGFSSVARKKRLEEKHLSDIKLSPRHWILIVLLLFSFLALILGFIFADCVALPHTNGTDGDLSDDSPSYNSSLYTRHYSKMSLPATSQIEATSIFTRDEDGLDNMVSGSTNTDTNTTLAEAEAKESKRLGFDSPKNLAILFFYTATLPLLTMLHTIFELIMLCCSNRRSSTNNSANSSFDNDTLSILKPLSLIQKQNSKSTPKAKLNTLLSFLPILSLTASLLLIAGWTTITSIQLHCEIPMPSISSKLPSQNLCPIQVRGHSMHGIHELSVVKSVFGYVLAVVYVVYAGICLRAVCLVAKAKKMARRTDLVARELEFEREMQLRKKSRESGTRFTVDETGRIIGDGKGKIGVGVVEVEV